MQTFECQIKILFKLSDLPCSESGKTHFCSCRKMFLFLQKILATAKKRKAYVLLKVCEHV